MSKVFTEGQLTGAPVEIHAGWDRPLGTAYLSVYRNGEHLLGSLFDPETAFHHLSFADIQQYAKRHNITASEKFWKVLEEHCLGQYANVQITV